MSSALRLTEIALSGVLLANSAISYQTNPSWYLYTPLCILAAIVSLVKFPENKIWRVLSSVSSIFGGIFTAFLLWTFVNLDGADFSEGKALLPVSLAAILSNVIGISSGSRPETGKFVKNLRTLILFAFLLVSVISLIYSTRYFQ